PWHRDGVPGLRALPAHDRARQRVLWPAAGKGREGRAGATCERDARLRRARQARRPLAESAIRRAAAARRRRARARAAARDPPPRRAALEPRREAARAAPLGAAHVAAAAEDDLCLRHPRSGRSALALGLDRGDERGPGRAAWRAVGELLPAEDSVPRRLRGRP